MGSFIEDEHERGSLGENDPDRGSFARDEPDRGTLTKDEPDRGSLQSTIKISSSRLTSEIMVSERGILLRGSTLIAKCPESISFFLLPLRALYYLCCCFNVKCCDKSWTFRSFYLCLFAQQETPQGKTSCFFSFVRPKCR